MANILVYALHYDGAINKNSLGAVSEGAKLAAEIGGEAHAILLGENVPQDLAASLGKYGAKKVLVAEGPEGLAQPLVDAMAAAITGGDYKYALFGGGLLGFEIGAGLAARLGAGVVMEVTSVRAENGELIAERPILGDSSISEVKYRSEVGIVIGRLNAFEINDASGADAPVEQLSFELSAKAQQATMLTRGEQRGADVDIEGADILVAGGRGLGKPEGFELMEELAQAFGGNAAVARPPPAPSSTPAGPPTRPRSARRVRPCPPSCTWPPGSPARSSTRSGCSPRRTSWPSTRTQALRSSSSPTSGSWVT